MNLETYALRHNAEFCDWSDTLDHDADARGWKCLALFTHGNDSEPRMLLVKSPSWPNLQVRNVSSEFANGTMLTPNQVKQWIKREAA